MTAISGSTHTSRTLVDGTLAIVVHIEPASAQAAFSLFGSPGTSIALAALIPEHKREKADEVKGGPLARLAGMWCKDERFWKWGGFAGEVDAAIFVRLECGVSSRSDIDEDAWAKETFLKNIRKPFMEYLRETDAGSDGF